MPSIVSDASPSYMLCYDGQRTEAHTGGFAGTTKEDLRTVDDE